MGDSITVTRMACAPIPTNEGEFTLCLYRNSLDDKEHLALLYGDVAAQASVLVRVHSECFTGDVLGSRRCDCGPQLNAALQLIVEEGAGILIYMRQEGRGIGLLEKLRAYNLQDLGYDTVDANLLLGHQPDLRDYRVAARMLQDQNVKAVRLLTNNPDKIEGLREAGLTVTARLPLETPIHAGNAAYMTTKARRMRHLLHLDREGLYDLSTPALTDSEQPGYFSANGRQAAELRELLEIPRGRPERPFVTLSYAQSMDGSIAVRRGEQTRISGPESQRLTHELRARHDAILVGIGTVLADDPRLTVRLVQGPDPQPVIVDSRLRLPRNTRLVRDAVLPAWVMTSEKAPVDRQRILEDAGARVLRLPSDRKGRVDLGAMLALLVDLGVGNLMVEGGATIISSFLAQNLVDRMILTVAPMVMGGLNAVSGLGRTDGRALPRLKQPHYLALGTDMILAGDVGWE